MSSLWPCAAALRRASTRNAPQPASARAAFTRATTWSPADGAGGSGAGGGGGGGAGGGAVVGGTAVGGVVLGAAVVGGDAATVVDDRGRRPCGRGGATGRARICTRRARVGPVAAVVVAVRGLERVALVVRGAAQARGRDHGDGREAGQQQRQHQVCGRRATDRHAAEPQPHTAVDMTRIVIEKSHTRRGDLGNDLFTSLHPPRWVEWHGESAGSPSPVAGQEQGGESR